MSDPEYRDSSLSVERRVEDLLSRMTIEEKAAQLGSIKASELLDGDGELDREYAESVLADGIGHITRFGGDAGLDPVDAATRANEVQRLLEEETQFGVPATPHEECLSGYMGPGGTTFPQTIGLAGTWSPELVESVTTEIRAQLLTISARSRDEPPESPSRSWTTTEPSR